MVLCPWLSRLWFIHKPHICSSLSQIFQTPHQRIAANRGGKRTGEYGVKFEERYFIPRPPLAPPRPARYVLCQQLFLPSSLHNTARKNLRSGFPCAPTGTRVTVSMAHWYILPTTKLSTLPPIPRHRCPHSGVFPSLVFSGLKLLLPLCVAAFVCVCVCIFVCFTVLFPRQC